MLFVVLADILEQPKRTRYMYLLAAIPHVTTLIAPLFANLFMRIEIWIPFAIAAGCLLSSFLVVWAMPESLIQRPADGVPDASAGSTSRLLDDGDERGLAGDGSQPTGTAEERTWRDHGNPSWSKTFMDIVALMKVRGMALCFGLSFLRPMALVSRAFVYQHASESFGWPMSRTTWLRFSQAIGSSLATLVLLPLVSAYVGRTAYPVKSHDLNVIRFSLLIASVGFTIIWQSKAGQALLVGLFVFGLGEGFEPSLKGLATSLIESSYNARLLTFITVLEVIAKLIGGPLMARLFSIGRNEDHGSDGVCFLASAVMLVLLACAASIARIQT